MVLLPKPSWRGIIVLKLVFALLVALFYAGENWRGKRVGKLQTRLEARNAGLERLHSAGTMALDVKFSNRQVGWRGRNFLQTPFQ